jgi:acetyl esterase/lipase
MTASLRWTAALAALAFLAAPAAAQRPPLPEGTKVEKDISYGPNGERNTLDLYLPPSEKPLPLIIWVHGGGWRSGSKAGGGPALRMAGRGYAVASINYRLSGMATFPAQIEDVKEAVRFLRVNAKKYNLDPDRFGAWGGSAGGHLVALLGTSGDVKELEGDGPNKEVSSRVQAVCDFFGPTDLAKLVGNSTNAQSPVLKLLGGPVADKKAEAERANPITHISKKAPPFLIVHGDKDTTVPLSQSELLHEALKKAGVESTLIVLPGAGHGGAAFNEPDTAKKIDEFFDKHLKKK